jgi:integrase
LLQTNGKSPADIAKDRKNVPHSYRAYLHVEDPLTGRRKTLEKTFPTKAAAQKWLNAELVTAEEDPLKLVSPTEHESPWTVTHLMQEWFRLVVDPSERELSTKENYHYMSRHIVRGLGEVPLMSLTGLAIQSFYGDLLAAGKSQRTVGLTHTVLKAALEQAVEWGKVLRNPAAKVHPPKGKAAKQIPQRALSVEQSQAFMAQVREDRLRNLWLFYLVSGVRRGEALGITWSDIDWDQNVVHIQRSINPKRVAGTTKTAAGRRTIPLPPIMVEALHQQRLMQNQDQRVWPDKWQQRPTPARDYVFLTRYGAILGPDNVFHYFKRLLTKAGLPETTRLHDLRHYGTHTVMGSVVT